MIKEQMKKERGITLVALVIAITILIIMIDVIIYNFKDRLEVENLKEMQTDIENLSDKISAYYVQYGKIPASIEYPIDLINQQTNMTDVISTADTGKFLIIDLSAIENLTLNQGRDFKKIEENKKNGQDISAKDYQDLYIINETSHNIFHVAGVTMNGYTYHTNYTLDKKDTVSVDLKYKDGIKIPEGFYYSGSEEEKKIYIKNKENEDEIYEWIPVHEKIIEIPSDVEVNITESEDFIKSVNVYHGYYKQIPLSTNNKVKYLSIDDNWSPAYDEEGIYNDKNGDTAYIPKGFQVSQTPGENTIEEGLVVKDNNNNEWIWIEVPKSIYTTAQSSDDYENIEKDIQSYTSVYRHNNYTDTWYAEEQHGFTDANAYNSFKNDMLKSVYENGGFYIGRYEAGTQDLRTSASSNLVDPVIQRGAYPYNYITCRKAQEKSKEIHEGERTSSLMFGMQWDLVMKFIEQKGVKIQSELKVNSANWGNYKNINFNLIRGKYSTNMGTSFSEEIKNQIMKENGQTILLTTGATNRNSALNIYDLAGNLWEWTLEGIEDTENPCTIRGGYCSNYGEYCPAATYSSFSQTTLINSVGFRPCLW